MKGVHIEVFFVSPVFSRGLWYCPETVFSELRVCIEDGAVGLRIRVVST